MITPEEIESIGERTETPFYLYDIDLLERTIRAVKGCSAVNPKFRVHYAMKACTEPHVLEAIREGGLGLDTVSGGEIELGIKAGFRPQEILFAGVGKTDKEIDSALQAGIRAFNVESLPELEVISERARKLGTTARVALRINPEIDAHTHHYITTGLAENKFGIDLKNIDKALNLVFSLKNLEFQGLHFHIGSQITIMEPFRLLCERINRIVKTLVDRNIKIRSINVGGGLAIDYDNPFANPIPDFKTYFDTFARNLDTNQVEEVHFELGRAITGQCAQLVTRVLYVKEGETRTFAIVDAGMTELIRPALYGARHAIRNISGELRGEERRKVDVVGPICESSDEFGKDYLIANPKRGDILAIASVGAYGQVMSSNYNARKQNAPVIRNKK